MACYKCRSPSPRSSARGFPHLDACIVPARVELFCRGVVRDRSDEARVACAAQAGGGRAESRSDSRAGARDTLLDPSLGLQGARRVRTEERGAGQRLEVPQLDLFVLARRIERLRAWLEVQPAHGARVPAQCRRTRATERPARVGRIGCEESAKRNSLLGCKGVRCPPARRWRPFCPDVHARHVCATGSAARAVRTR